MDDSSEEKEREEKREKSREEQKWGAEDKSTEKFASDSSYEINTDKVRKRKRD